MEAPEEIALSVDLTEEGIACLQIGTTNYVIPPETARALAVRLLDAARKAEDVVRNKQLLARAAARGSA